MSPSTDAAEALRCDGAALGLVVLTPCPKGDLTPWEVHLAPQGRGSHVTSVDCIEECTGP